MVMELFIPSSASVDATASLRGQVQASSAASRRPAALSLPAATEVAGDDALHAAATRAASALYSDREVEVSSFHDEDTGRMVHRIADPRSGRVLMQSPSEELLRFYASSRASQGPLLAIDA
jgi:hypothetical protein